MATGQISLAISLHASFLRKRSYDNMKEEVWKDIKGFEGKYQISNLGRVKSLPKRINSTNGGRMTKERILKLNDHKGKHYLSVEIGRGNWFTVHRLVAEAFVPNPLNKEQVNHKDGNKLNACADNLEWVTQSENMLHAYKTGLEKKRFGVECPWSWRKIKAIHKSGVEYIFDSVKECSKVLGIRDSAIGRVRRGERTHCHGYKFEML